MTTGVGTLSRSLPPWPVAALEPCAEATQPSGQGWFAYAGTWLAVLGRSVAADPGLVDATWYLDAARALLTEAAEREPTDALAVALWQHGLETLQQFATGRDPGLAEWSAGMQKPGFGAAIVASVYAGHKSLRLDQPDVPVLVGEPASLAEALPKLIKLSCSDQTDPLAVASSLMRLEVILPRFRRSSSQDHGMTPGD